MKNTRIKIRRVHQLLDDVNDGRFAIPKLQREFVWDGKKAAKLVDSILSGLPIGVPMIWDTPSSQRLNLREKYHVLPAFNKRNKRVWFIIDGQQRVSVLHHAQRGDELPNSRRKFVDFKRIVIALGKAEDGKLVQYRRPQPGEYVSICDVLDPHWHKRLSALGKSKLRKIRRFRESLRKYPMRFMFVDGTIDEVKQCFLRVNTLGMKVTTADKIIADAETLDIRDFTHEVRAQIVDPGFMNIPEMPILFALVATQKGRSETTEARGRALQSQVRKLEEEANRSRPKLRKLGKDWTRLAACFGKAVNYLEQQFSVLSRDYLGYDYIISMLALFYFWNGRGPSEHQKREIRKWFWATCFGQRYAGSEFLRCVPEDTKFFKKLARSSRETFHYKPLKDQNHVVNTQYASRTGIGCAVYCLLISRGPVSLMEDGLNEIPHTRYTAAANRKDRHHIFPRAIMRDLETPSRYNSIVNVCLLTTEENKKIGNKQPRNYLTSIKSNTTYFKRKMDHHLIPWDEESGIWLKNLKRGFTQFIKQRAGMICEAAEREAQIQLFRRD
jgi:hypothetical protein